MAKDIEEKPAPTLEAMSRIETGQDYCVKSIQALIKIIRITMDEAESKGNRAPDLIALYRRVYNADEVLSEVMKTLGALKDIFKYKLLPEAYEREGISTLTTSERDRVNVVAGIRASILAEDRSEVYRWLRDNGHGSIIQETVNSGTLVSFVKAELEQNRGVHEKIKVEPVGAASLTRGTKPAKPT
jgi:hypothetical protein